MNKTAVLIDDDQDDLDILEEIIREIDESVVIRPYIMCDKALQDISDDLDVVPHYIFIDLNMPKIAGDDCLKQLRTNPKFHKSTITVLSTSMPDSVSRVLKSLGADYTFQKPSSLSTYYNILKNILSVQN
ncbi:MAG TPA: response regulator [Chryseolinea sp.]